MPNPSRELETHKIAHTNTNTRFQQNFYYQTIQPICRRRKFFGFFFLFFFASATFCRNHFVFAGMTTELSLLHSHSPHTKAGNVRFLSLHSFCSSFFFIKMVAPNFFLFFLFFLYWIADDGLWPRCGLRTQAISRVANPMNSLANRIFAHNALVHLNIGRYPIKYLHTIIK